MKINGKVFVVTGAGGGIGGELVKVLVRRGAKVAACDINESALAGLKQTVGSEQVSIHKIDITDRDAVFALPEAIIREHGAVDGVVNCAGIIQPFVKVQDIEFSAVERVMNVNFYGTLHMVKAFLPYLLERPEAHIVNVSSMGGFLPVPGQAIYGASKAAVKLLTEALYAELKNTNVHVTVVFPGATKTDIAKHSGVETKEEPSKESKIPMLLPSEVAELIAQGIEQNRFQVFTGKDSRSMNLLYRLSPKFAVDLITRQMGDLLK